MHRTSDWFSYTIRKGDPGRSEISVTYLLVPSLPEDIRALIVRKTLAADEQIIFVGPANKVLLHDDKSTKIQVLVYDQEIR